VHAIPIDLRLEWRATEPERACMGMQRRAPAVAVKVLASLCLSQPLASESAASPAETVADEFEALFRTHVAEESIPGAAFVIATPDGILRLGTAGYTDTAHSRRIDESTVFRIASVSKTFAAGLTAQLVSEGRVGWDDRVVDYVPAFRIKGDSGRVRIQDLLGQSTGLVPHAYDNLIEDGVPLDRIEKRFSELQYICEPGACYSYQNILFSLIGPVIEKTTSQSYEQAMEERIFRPLQMQTASIGYEPFINSPNHALPHVKVRGQWKTVSVKPNYYAVAPAAGVNASAADMGKWLAAQMGGVPAIIDPAMVEKLIRPRVETEGDTHRKFWRDVVSEAYYGLGWRIYRVGGYDIAYHSGWVSGYRADLAWSQAHDIGIAVLMNAEDSSINEITTSFWKLALEQIPPTAGLGRTTMTAGLSPGAH
jgi:beta-lactamase class C